MSDLTGTSTKEQLAYNRFVSSPTGGLAPIPNLQANTIHTVVGPPSNAVGVDGDIAIRRDGAGGTTVYHKRTGAWVGVV